MHVGRKERSWKKNRNTYQINFPFFWVTLKLETQKDRSLKKKVRKINRCSNKNHKDRSIARLGSMIGVRGVCIGSTCPSQRRVAVYTLAIWNFVNPWICFFWNWCDLSVSSLFPFSLQWYVRFSGRRQLRPWPSSLHLVCGLSGWDSTDVGHGCPLWIPFHLTLLGAGGEKRARHERSIQVPFFANIIALTIDASEFIPY